MEEYIEFINDIKKVYNSRNHKVTGSIGVYDIYKHIRKHSWYNIPRPLKESEFYKIIRRINSMLALELGKGKEINLPHRLGTLEIRKRPSRIAIVNGKVVTNLPIDWDATFKLWFTDEQAKKEKLLVRIENEDIFKVYYNKNKAEYTNKTFYDFKPNREIKRSLTRQARQGNLDAFLLKRYD